MTRRPNHAQRYGVVKAQLPLAATWCLAAMLQAGAASAGCAPGNGGPRDYLCTGAITATSFIDARTVAFSGVTSSGGVSIAPNTGGNIGFSMDALSSVRTTYIGEVGVSLVTSDGSIDTNSPTGSGIILTANGLILTNRHVAGTYWHWYFLSQPEPFPEHMIGLDPDFFYETCLVGWGKSSIGDFDAWQLGEYRRCWRDPSMITGSSYAGTIGSMASAGGRGRSRTSGCPLTVTSAMYVNSFVARSLRRRMSNSSGVVSMNRVV